MQDHKCSGLIYCSLFHLARTHCQIELCCCDDTDEDLSCILIHICKFFLPYLCVVRRKRFRNVHEGVKNVHKGEKPEDEAMLSFTNGKCLCK